MILPAMKRKKHGMPLISPRIADTATTGQAEESAASWVRTDAITDCRISRKSEIQGNARTALMGA